ncbi:rhotekin-like isoform X2 [Megalops cyprinoides]|uniref:rhotekin-like isoform X2 n=1 Tax=Megalops cyprinoides TaxID=118141 RepID=UPI00186430D1|nr:rhotekin-like isoform X2 [Megalops cyprinoides]
MFCRNQTTRATVARGSALEMEIRRGKFRMSVFLDTLQDSDIQKKIDHEIRMREGTCKLLAACSQRDQALEAAKGLLTCNARILAYMSELQRMKEAQVMQRVARRSSADAGPMDERLPCKGKVAISDLRIPLMWKDTEYFKNKGELHRCAVFCVLQLGGEIYDTDMVMVDRTLTDICFENTIVFSEAGPGFELRVELYSCCTEEEFSSGAAPRKLASKLSSSLGRSSGKKIRVGLEPGACSPVSNGGGAPLLLPSPSVPGPKYHLLAHATLKLTHVRDSFRTHDLSISGNEECSYWLPLYGSVCCRLVAQPDCMTQQMMSGTLQVKLGEDSQSWTKVYGVLSGTNLICYHQQEDVEAKVEPAFTIAINKETRIRATEKDPHSKAQSISVSNQYGGEDVTHTLATDSREEMQRWMEAFWQHFYDMSQWKQCCDDLMKIEVPSPRKPIIVIPKQGSLYHEMVIDATDDLGTVTDILKCHMQEFKLRGQLGAAPPWMSLFEGDQSQHPIPQVAGHSPRPQHRAPRSPRPGRLSSDTSLTSDSDSPCSTSPCSRHAWPETPPRTRPRTLSLDARLSGLQGRGCTSPPRPSSSSSPRPPQPGLSCSSSTSSNSSSEGSTTPDLEGSPFPRAAPGRRSLRDLRTKLDPQNWLQSQV